MEMVRGGVLLALGFLGMGACSGGGGSSSRVECPRSIEELCSLSAVHCSLTWDEVQAGLATCSLSNDVSYDLYEISDCGNYHRLIYRATDTGASFYYDAASGELVAVVSPGSLGSKPECGAGPADGFEIPSCDFPDGAVPIDCGADGAVM
jgi:hypothetical protein